MKIENYSPTFRYVLIEEVRNQMTKGGIILPLSSVDTAEKPYRVIKTGRDCIEVKPGDFVYIAKGISLDPVGEYFQVMEMQIKGYEREPVA